MTNDGKGGGAVFGFVYNDVSRTYGASTFLFSLFRPCTHIPAGACQAPEKERVRFVLFLFPAPLSFLPTKRRWKPYTCFFFGHLVTKLLYTPIFFFQGRTLKTI